MRKASKSPLHEELLRTRIAELKSSISAGAVREAIVRGMLYIGMGRGAVDERSFEAVRRIRLAHGDIPLATFKQLVHDQFNMMLIDTETALSAIPSMLPPNSEIRGKAFALIKEALSARGEFSAEDKKRLNKIASLFGINSAPDTHLTVVTPIRSRPKAS